MCLKERFGASRPASLQIGRESVGFEALGVECGSDVGGEHDPLARLAIEAAFPDFDPTVL